MNNQTNSKTPSQSEVIMNELVMPHHTNPQMTVFGGTVMSWIDIAAAMCAAKHCNKAVVTAHISDIDFLAPIKIGEHVSIKASVNFTGKTSIIVGVKVTSENPYTQETRTTTKAYLTFVALDSHGKPASVPSIIPETEDEIRRYNNAKERREAQKELRTKLKQKL